VVRPLLAARIREFRGDIAGPDGAKASYLAARPSKPVIAAAVAAAPPQQAVALQQLYAQMKEDATYWLGVLTLAEGEYEAAVDYLERMTLAAAPDSRWADAARIHLAEAFLALGRREDAVALLRADTSPQRFGSRLRAAAVAAAGPAAEAAGAKLDSSR
jgi:tetratricopeptide (TPR) repeat protein